MSIEIALPADRDAILAVARAVSVFTEEEVLTVNELFDGYLRDPQQSGYNFLVYRTPTDISGFACWGPTPLSHGACDLYWICAAPQAQQRGVGAALFQAVVAEAQKRHRWLIMIWTSNRPEYEPARRFYYRQGCTLAAQIPDFYARGEDLCAFVYRW